MGVWIETIDSHKKDTRIEVTPCMGVWIETKDRQLFVAANKSHPVWVCGLKLDDTIVLDIHQSHTLYGCVD